MEPEQLKPFLRSKGSFLLNAKRLVPRRSNQLGTELKS